MCGIIGYYSRQVTSESLDLLFKLILESKIRGLHSFGWAWYEESILSNNKQQILPTFDQLEKFIGYKDFRFIYHNRYSTSGDYHNVINNQPIVDSGIAVAVNGVITMTPKDEWFERFGTSCETENDAEILLRWLDEYVTEYVELQGMKIGSLAAVYLMDNELYTLRNIHRPLHYIRKYDSVYIVSTRDIARRAGIPQSEVYDIVPNKQIKVEDLLEVL